MVIQLCKHTLKNHYTVYFKWVNFMVCKSIKKKKKESNKILHATQNQKRLAWMVPGCSQGLVGPIADVVYRRGPSDIKVSF